MDNKLKVLIEAVLDKASLSRMYTQISDRKVKVNVDVNSQKAVTDLQRLTQAGSIQTWMKSNSKAVKHFGSELDGMIKKLRSSDDMTKTELNSIKSHFKEIQIQARQTGDIGKTAGDKLRNAWEKFGGWSLATGSLMAGWRSLKKGVSEIIQLDTSMIDLAKTTTMTKSELKDFYYVANDIAKEMGVTTNEIIKQASAWSRLGYNTSEQSKKMAKLSSQFAQISPDMNVDKATNGLVSVMKAFEIDPDNVLDGIMSKINIIGKMNAETI